MKSFISNVYFLFLTPFDTRDLLLLLLLLLFIIRSYYYFELNLRLTLLIKVLLTKQHVTFYCGILNTKKYFPLRVYFCICPLFHWGDMVKKMFNEVQQKYKTGGKLSIEGEEGVQPNCHHIMFLYNQASGILD